MTKLTEKDKPFQWNEEQQKAFQDLKEIQNQAFISIPHLQSKGDFILDTDASNEAVAVVQVQDEQEKLIAYGSKMLTKTD